MAEYKKYSAKTEGQMMEEKKDPMSGALPNQKTSYMETFDYNEQPETALKAKK